MRAMRMVCFGDSLMWGQGLLPAEKFAQQVWDALAPAPGDGRPRTPRAEEFILRAHAGAQIGAVPRPAAARTGAARPSPGVAGLVFGLRPVPPWITRELAGEIGNPAPTVYQQLAGFDGDTRSVDLVLVNGGGNDVGVFWYMNPATPIAALKRRIEQYCYHDMAELLLKVADAFPHACIVVPGYMQSLSPATGRGLAAGGVLVRVLGRLGQVLLDRVFERNRIFREETARQLRRAVESASAVLDKRPQSGREAAVQSGDATFRRRIVFADVAGFGDENTANGSDPWVWGVDAAAGAPQDGLCEFRRGVCTRLGHWSPWYWASVGHPNARGAREIADGILQSLQEWCRHNTESAFEPLRTAVLRAMRGQQ